jgi:DNA-binding response OmpR family regulator
MSKRGGCRGGTEALLVVEEDPSLRHLAKDVLEAQGYEVLSAQNGQEALQVTDNHKGSPIRLVKPADLRDGAVVFHATGSP